jgi:hypothetical protein
MDENGNALTAALAHATTATVAEAEDVPLPTCQHCQRQAGLSGGCCAFCLAKTRGWTEEEAAEMDRALTALRREAVRDGWVGKSPDGRLMSAGKTYRVRPRKGDSDSER